VAINHLPRGQNISMASTSTWYKIASIPKLASTPTDLRKLISMVKQYVLPKTMTRFLLHPKMPPCRCLIIHRPHRCAWHWFVPAQIQIQPENGRNISGEGYYLKHLQ
jgi:hypothetical protein